MARRFRYKDIQLPQLRSFCVAATHGNFTAAAKVLGLSAPTVWEQVRGLERLLGATLLLRRGRLVELTPEGRLLLDLVQPHVSGLDSLEKLFTAHRAGGLPQLTLASSPNLLVNYLVTPVQDFTRAYPSVCVSLRPSISVEEGLRFIERGQADLGFLALAGDQRGSAPLEYEHLFDLRLVLITAPDHPLARKKKLTLKDIVAYPLITQRDGSASRVAFDSMLRKHELLDQVRIVMESSHAEVIRTYVAAGLGVSFFYATKDAPTLQGLHRRDLDPQMEGLPVFLIQRKGVHLSEPVAAFRDILLKQYRTDPAP